jgi:hypothetical protein
MWGDIGKTLTGRQTARNTSMAQLFGDELCATAILGFLVTTKVGLSGPKAPQLVGKEDEGETQKEEVGGFSEDAGK